MENSRELILIAEAVAKEKGLSKQEVLDILSESVEVALRKKFPEGALVQVSIDEKTGDMTAWRLFELVDSIENVEGQMLKSEIENEEVIDGYVWEKFEFALTRQQFNIVKQVALQKIKNHSRDNYIHHLLNKPINLHSGTVKGIKKDFFIVDTNGVDIVIYKRSIPMRETYKNGDKIRFTLKEQNGHYVGDRASEEFLLELFKEEISYVENGEVSIMAIARNPGFRSKVIVAPAKDNGKLDAVRTCIGSRGVHVKNIQQEINGEFIDIIGYSEDPAQLLISAISPVNVTKIVMDEDAKKMEIAVEESGLALAIGRGGKNIDMISKLIGWEIKVYSENEWETRQVQEQEALKQYFAFGLNCDAELAEYVVESGYLSLDEIAYIPEAELDFQELDSETIAALKENALETIKDQEKNKQAEGIKTLYSLGFESDEVETLLNENVLTLESVADLSTYDLQDYLPNIDIERAKNIIMKSRQEQTA
jgi:transcription termination/antitermination protein NusA